jgi:hypothetical protein
MGGICTLLALLLLASLLDCSLNDFNLDDISFMLNTVIDCGMLITNELFLLISGGLFLAADIIELSEVSLGDEDEDEDDSNLELR